MEFKDILQMYRKAFKEGDAKAIAEEAGCSTTSVYKIFKREYAFQFTDLELRIYGIMTKRLGSRIAKSFKTEQEAKKILGV